VNKRIKSVSHFNFQEDRDLHKFSYVQCQAIFTCSWAWS